MIKFQFLLAPHSELMHDMAMKGMQSVNSQLFEREKRIEQ